MISDLAGLFPQVTHGAILLVVILELLQHVVVGIALAELLWCFDSLDDPFRVLILLLLDMFLDVLWVVALQTVRLNLKAIVEICKILNEVMHGLRSLLLFGQRYLEDLADHAIHILDRVVRICHLLLNDETCGFEWAVQRNMSRILHLLVIISIERKCLFVLLLDQLLDDRVLICLAGSQNFVILLV